MKALQPLTPVGRLRRKSDKYRNAVLHIPWGRLVEFTPTLPCLLLIGPLPPFRCRNTSHYEADIKGRRQTYGAAAWSSSRWWRDSFRSRTPTLPLCTRRFCRGPTRSRTGCRKVRKKSPRENNPLEIKGQASFKACRHGRPLSNENQIESEFFHGYDGMWYAYRRAHHNRTVFLVYI